MYTLTLTHDERLAFDWIGFRYSNGREMADLLCDCSHVDSDAWQSKATITFSIPEHTAWGIVDLAEQDDMLFPCFADSLRSKMLSFCDRIV